jgi:hypothetical protein
MVFLLGAFSNKKATRQGGSDSLDFCGTGTPAGDGFFTH